MSQATHKGPGGSSYKDYPFQDKLDNRKEHFKMGSAIKRAKSGVVKFRVQDIMDLIRDKDLEKNPDAKLVFHFAAYKEDDWETYQTKPGAKESEITREEFLNRPTLILAYENSPISLESFDCGVLCPPPQGC